MKDSLEACRRAFSRQAGSKSLDLGVELLQQRRPLHPEASPIPKTLRQHGAVVEILVTPWISLSRLDGV